MDWTYIITEIVKWLVGLAASAAGVAATAWLRSRKEIEVNKETDEARRALLEEAEKAVQTAVDFVNQTITSGIKGTEAWTDEAQKDAKAKAASVFETIMGDSGMTLLYATLDNVKEWVNAKIEAAVLQGKTADGLIAASSPVEVGVEAATIPADSKIGEDITELISDWQRERDEKSYVPVQEDSETEATAAEDNPEWPQPIVDGDTERAAPTEISER